MRGRVAGAPGLRREGRPRRGKARIGPGGGYSWATCASVTYPEVMARPMERPSMSMGWSTPPKNWPEELPTAKGSSIGYGSVRPVEQGPAGASQGPARRAGRVSEVPDQGRRGLRFGER